MRRMTTVEASTKRLPVVSGGKRGAAVTHLAKLQITPLEPVDAELRQRVDPLKAAHELHQAFADGAPDVRQGDILVVDSVEYPIRAAAAWSGRRPCVHLVVEEVKGAS